MSRELLVELIKRKKAIHQANHDLVIEELSIEEKLALCPEEEESAIEAELLEVKQKEIASNAQLHRAYFFTQRHTHGLVPHLCPTCFVDHGEETFMVEVTSERGNGIRQFECVSCGYVVRVNPV